MEEQKVIVVQNSNLAGILAIVFAILGIFFLAIVFVPLAVLLAIFATYKAVKKNRLTNRSNYRLDTNYSSNCYFAYPLGILGHWLSC